MGDLALEYFKIGNGVVVFYIVQSFLFLHATYKEPKLLTALCNNRALANRVTWFIASFYIVVVFSIACLELWLHCAGLECLAQSSAVVGSSIIAATGRIVIIVALAGAISKLICKYLKDEHENA